jgi:FixJ family two-component response regulator
MINEPVEAPPFVVVVDDDASMRDALKSLFRSVGMHAEAYSSPAEFLLGRLPEIPGCLVVDIRMPGMSGLDFQADLAKANDHTPIVFMTGHGDIPMTVKAMRAGAVEFLTKPFRNQDMLDAVQHALAASETRREGDKALAKLKADYETLTPREKEVMALVTAGLMNKQIAGDLAVSEITVKVHRSSVTRKMGAHSLAHLVRMADSLGVSRSPP